MIVNYLLLALCIALSSTRNMCSKSISSEPFGQKNFFLQQLIIFATGGVLLLFLSIGSLGEIAWETVIYAIIYAAMIITAQWTYTMALSTGGASICATVYSLGFIFPTLSGMMFWGEEVTVFKIIGIILVIPALIFAGRGKGTSNAKLSSYIVPMMIACFMSGALGILQKIHGTSTYASQKNQMVLIAFGIAALVSLCAYFIAEKSEKAPTVKSVSITACIGICFGACNLINTVLAAALDSAVLFPLLNIGIVLLSLFLSMLLFHEKFTKNHLFLIIFAVAAILFINL